MSSGDILKMVSTDPGSKNDISAWANRTGNALLSSGEHGSDFVYYIQKS
jgi:tRNA 2-thiouridine synthesizing protein A